MKDTRFECLGVLSSEADGKVNAAAHAETDHNRCEKCHQSVGGAYRRQSLFSDKLTDDQRIGDIVKLLQEIPYHHRKREKQQRRCDFSFGKILIHVTIPFC